MGLNLHYYNSAVVQFLLAHSVYCTSADLYILALSIRSSVLSVLGVPQPKRSAPVIFYIVCPPQRDGLTAA